MFAIVVGSVPGLDIAVSKCQAIDRAQLRPISCCSWRGQCRQLWYQQFNYKHYYLRLVVPLTKVSCCWPSSVRPSHGSLSLSLHPVFCQIEFSQQNICLHFVRPLSFGCITAAAAATALVVPSAQPSSRSTCPPAAQLLHTPHTLSHDHWLASYL